MTRQEAEEYLARNPKCRDQIDRLTPEMAGKFDAIWAIGCASNHEDGGKNLLEVYRAMHSRS